MRVEFVMPMQWPPPFEEFRPAMPAGYRFTAGGLEEEQVDGTWVLVAPRSTVQEMPQVPAVNDRVELLDWPFTWFAVQWYTWTPGSCEADVRVPVWPVIEP